MAFQKLTMQVGAVGTLNAPLTITTNLEVKSWILEDLRLNTQEITLGTEIYLVIV
jgi:hypothetical protein